MDIDSRRRAKAKRRRKNSKDNDASARAIWIQRIWNMAVKKEVVGVLCLIAGIVFMLSPSVISLSHISRAWFVTPLFNVEVIRAGMTLLVIAFFVLLSLGIENFSSRSLASRFPMKAIGGGLMVASIGIAIFSWASFHFFLPVSKVSLTSGETVESLPMHHVLGRTKVMLPMKTTLKEMDANTESADLLFRKLDDEQGVTETIQSGDPIVAGNFRFALLGVEYNKKYLQARLSKPGKNTIEQKGSIGTKIQFSPKESPLTISEISRNYMGVMGPAVQLTTEDGEKFWAFERSPATKIMSREIAVLGLETAPLVVMGVSDSRFMDLVWPLVFVFILGWLLFIGLIGFSNRNEKSKKNHEGSV